MMTDQEKTEGKAGGEPPVSGFPVSEMGELVRALLEVKSAFALAAADLGALPRAKADAVLGAVLALKADPAAFAADKSSPYPALVRALDGALIGKADGALSKDDLELSQASTDVYLNAANIALYRLMGKTLEEAQKLEAALYAKAFEFKGCPRCGRTGQRDSLPMTFGQVFAGWAAGISRARRRLEALRLEFLEVIPGAGLLGTGFGVPPGFREKALSKLSEATGLSLKIACEPLSPIADAAYFEAVSSHGRFLAAASAAKGLAFSLSKMANDLYVFSSGPRTGYREFVLPAVAPGSSIMPGKLNPLMPELVLQVSQQVYANETFLSQTSNDLSLDTDLFAAENYNAAAESFYILTGAMRQFTNLCAKGITVNAGFAAREAAKSSALAEALRIKKGKDAAQKLKAYMKEHKASAQDAAAALGLLSGEGAGALFDLVTLSNAESSAKVLFTAEAAKEE